jgi:hypothetical protein
MAQDIQQLRQIILALQDKTIPKASEAALSETRGILRAEGLIDTFDDSRIAEGKPHPLIGLTAEGQRFSEQIRDEAQWNDVIETLKQEGVEPTFHEIRERLEPKSP